MCNESSNTLQRWTTIGVLTICIIKSTEKSGADAARKLQTLHCRARICILAGSTRPATALGRGITSDLRKTLSTWPSAWRKVLIRLARWVSRVENGHHHTRLLWACFSQNLVGSLGQTHTYSGTIVGGRFQRVQRQHLPPVFVETPRPPHPPPTAFQRNPTRE
jgi:hypothetical protein